MKSIRWRLRPLVVLGILTGATVALVTAYFSAKQFLRAALTPRLDPDQLAAILDEFGNASVAYAAIALVLTGVLAVALAGIGHRWLTRLRAETVARSRGQTPAPTKPPVAELQALSGAIDNLTTDLQDKAAALLRERDELALLIASVSEGILLAGPDGRIIHANPAAKKLLGLPDACRGQLLPALVRNAELRAILEGLERRGPAVTAEVALDDRRLLVRGQPLARGRTTPDAPETAAETPAVVIAFVDLTELRRLEGVRRDFVANVSHELKTPLTSIRGYAETLLSDDLDATTQKQFVEVIQKNADRLHTMVDDLLDLSRLESGGWTPTLLPVSVAAVAAESWNAFAERARDKNISFVPPPQDALVLADESALNQILSNLFDNAIRHTGPGGSIRVIVRTDAATRTDAGPMRAPPARTDPLVVIEVQDSGSGIPSDALARIFERFYRVDPARSRTEGGTGLGLSIVKHMVESMNGDVTAASELGKGTTIRIRLPAAA